MATEYDVGTKLDVPPRALHFSTGKPATDQLPPEVLLEWAKVFAHGAEKYGRDNWKKGTNWSEFYGSALRHGFKYWLGEDRDPDSGELHLAHFMWNVGALMYFFLHGLGTDDRPAPYRVEPVKEVKD